MADIGRSKADSIAESIAAIDPEVDVTPAQGVAGRRQRAGNGRRLRPHHGRQRQLRHPLPHQRCRRPDPQTAGVGGHPALQRAGIRSFADYGPTYRDLFPQPPAAGEVLSCSVGGVLPAVCAAIGAIMSAEAIKLITGIGEPLIGRVTTYDALNGRYRELEYGAIPDAEPVTALTDYELFCGVAPSRRSEDAEDAEDASSMSVTELSRRLRAGEPLQLVDVREPFESRSPVSRARS